MAHRLLIVTHGLVQTACTSLNVFFSSMGLTISASKLKKNTNARRYWYKSDPIQIFGYIFRFWVAIELPCEIYRAKMPSKSKLIEIGGRCFLGSAFFLFDTAV
jgi:hypothetical protein